ncbi:MULTISPECIES: GNAT family N-acetyltransferase [Acidiphilium]|jgi:ribosomal protein S18 acetylase RimI-like enzyme|uniref:GCN5-related N-acetyltransferase n=2 Tax=Acidiphilium TaxID=522 RepID=A5FXE0_ACICJ|nr:MULTISPECIES: GNAT family N-acetyltransferase [Acidiphilium]MBU6357393.1 GNAT family N-acetyltransferase [Rhodospirillales bacterium]ABQ30272.1 GCN5-related N-acetyltransferase [Acidiphilium cryptum JF-5]EGO95535.1 GCN5-related N-acetyltransferase [Acidiphilium sp. PM]KDM66114.1 GCN5-like N-acetyltransferase [Acidiphilium sp. JA12-A1]MBS3022331.1 GNAT family N-acetyltransferase [Acidiphilium multivorum]
MEAACSIRAAGEADLAAVARITAAAYGPYVAEFGAPPVPMTDDHAARIARGETFLAEIAHDPVGLVSLELHDDHALVFSVAVDPPSQGRGLAGALLRFAETRARGAGRRELRLYTNARMTRNIAIYLAHGFRETGRRPHPHRAGWTLVDMAKTLDRP